MRKYHSSRRTIVRGMAAFMAASTFIATTQSVAAPADIFSSPAPVIGAAAPKAAELKPGEASVSTQTGALTYGYPITVPPGRGGMAPRLSLNYSSQASIYGGIASGWSLSLPAIVEDTSQGRLRTRADEMDYGQPTLVQIDDDRYISTMAGNRPLVRVVEPSTATGNTYRAQYDASYTRYERNASPTASKPYYWRAFLTSGVIMTFGDPNRMNGCPYLGLDYAPLTGEVDSFGNEVKYNYEWNRTTNDCHIQEISWGMNAAAGITQPFAKVRFSWDFSTFAAGNYPVGASRSYRTGHLVVEGADRLNVITATAFPPGGAVEHTREITLTYDMTAEAKDAPITHAPLRLLKSIKESAWGSSGTMPRVDLPAVEFTYAPLDTTRSTAVMTTGMPWQASNLQQNLGWGYRRTSRSDRVEDRWPSVESIMIDMDGDGLLDRLFNTSWDTPQLGCTAEWRKNLGLVSGVLTFAGVNSDGHYNRISLPRLKWKGNAVAQNPASPFFEGCSLNGQVTTYKNSHDVANICHDKTSCAASANPAKAGTFCNPGGTQCPLGDGGGGNAGEYRTYLAYRWLDADGDGLTDLVAAIHGDIDTYDVVRGNDLGMVAEPVPFGLGTWPVCPGTMDICEDIGGCMSKVARNCSSGSCVPDWGALGACYASHLDTGCSKLTGDMTSVPSGGVVQRAPYTRCEGLYPWFIFKNTGKGVLDAVPTVKYQPLPLESDGGDSQIESAGIFSQDHAILDFDGDGWLDAIAHGKTDPAGNPDGWYVWLGDGSGGMGGKRYFFPTRSNAGGKNRISASDDNITGQQKLGLLDFNGDGLPDHWLDMGSPSNVANVTFHDGTKFELAQLPNTNLIGSTDTPAGVIPRYLSVSTITEHEFTGGPVKTGTAAATSRPMDVDNDGRVDLVQTSGSTSTVFYNVGGQLIAPGSPYPGDKTGLSRDLSASFTATGPNSEDRVWELKSDLIDLDGDGAPEGVRVNGSELWIAKPSSVPPRLMTSIKNNHGLTSTITYASMHSPTVTQSPSSTWSFDGRPKATPATQWVVASIRVDDDFDTFPSSGTTTTYQYINPRHGADDTGRFAFRGFETVVTTGQSGAKTTQSYGYNIDWSGRLVKTVVSSAEAPTMAATIDKTDYQQLQPPLFGVLKTIHPVRSDHYVCSDNQDENTCVASPAAYTNVVTDYSAKASDVPGQNGTLLMYIESTVRTRHGLSNADGDRVVVYEPKLGADETNYRLREGATTRKSQIAGTLVTYAKHETTWNPAAPLYTRKASDKVWVDDVEAHQSITQYSYDAATGNLLSTTTPRGFTTSYEYDDRNLFVRYENSPYYAKNLEFTHEYGTGATIETRGPNVAVCAQPNPPGACPTNQTALTKQTSRVVLDGLGRMLERKESVTVDPSNLAYYELRTVETNSYGDGLLGTVPSVTHRAALKEVGASITYLKDITEFDGHGRPTSVIKYSQGAAIADHVTTYRYGLDGTLQSVKVPDPTEDDASQVEYVYTFDSLGRATTVRRPDSQQSGATISYSGLTTTTTEVASSPAKLASTRRTLDSDGRLAKVEEYSPACSATNWCSTLYMYGPDDNVKQITDPESKVTLLAHDQAGHRTSVTRNGLVWTYKYDLDGNLASEMTPSAATCTPQPACKDNYTTTMVYDAVDRLTMKYLARRDLSDPDLTLFGAAQESYWYDINGLGGNSNTRGRLTQWRSIGVGGVETQNQAFMYDVQGNVLLNWMAFNSGGFGLSRYTQQTYLLSGLPLRTYHDPLTTSTVSEVDYDQRGLPKSVSISVNNGITFGPPIYETRNVAGLVRLRNVFYPNGSPMEYAHSQWTYDVLGRVTDQTVSRGPSAQTQVARQQLTYLGNDDVSRLVTYFGTTAKQQDFTYDERHQLLTAVATPSSYFQGTYRYGAAGRFNQATVAQTSPPASSEVKPRNVFYNYAGTDPELVTSLTTGSLGGAAYVTYTYSPEGNQLTKVEAATGDSYAYAYDGSDRLRRATKKHNNVVTGSEEYWYDSSGYRSQVVKRDSLGTATELVWYHGVAESRYTLSGTTSTLGHTFSYVTLGTPVARVDRAPDGSATTEYQFHGLAGSTLTAISSTGTINTTFNYAPFGELIESTNAGGAIGGTAVHARRFNDKEQDSLTSLIYYGARYYDRTLMSWTQVDPLYLRAPDIAKQSTMRRSNLAVFSLNNPVRYIDPDGLDSQNGMTHWTDSFNSDRSARVAAAGADDTTGTEEHRRYMDALVAYFFSGRGGATGATGVTTGNACDGIHGVCEDNDISSNALLGLSAGPLGVDPVAQAFGFYEGVVCGLFGCNNAWAPGPNVHPTDRKTTWEEIKSYSLLAGTTLIGGYLYRYARFAMRSAPYAEGTFSISNWSGYPEGYPRPLGPFRLLEGGEYDAARKAANAANRALHRAQPSWAGQPIHEIHPVKFGGNPTSLWNKDLPGTVRHAELTSFWNAVQRTIEGK